MFNDKLYVEAADAAVETTPLSLPKLYANLDRKDSAVRCTEGMVGCFNLVDKTDLDLKKIESLIR